MLREAIATNRLGSLSVCSRGHLQGLWPQELLIVTEWLVGFNTIRMIGQTGNDGSYFQVKFDVGDRASAKAIVGMTHQSEAQQHQYGYRHHQGTHIRHDK